VQLFRVFPWDGRSRGNSAGGPFYVPRHKQGAGRHDIPERDGVVYCSEVAISAVAEAIKSFRGQVVSQGIFTRPDGTVLSLATFELDDSIALIDLDDTVKLTSLGIAPSKVASPHRTVTQGIARKLFDEGNAGFTWWSALKSSWKNATLFESRVRSYLKIRDIGVLGVDMAIVGQAADEMLVRIAE
jgi:hypothetical protein